MALAVGSRIGQYEVLSAIGAGGMGEVYRARDNRLGRDVALKVLPDLLAADPERRARFDHEARTVAALNHPNIVTIYSVEESGGTRFLTMEIVEGQTLDALLPPRGLPLPELLETTDETIAYFTKDLFSGRTAQRLAKATGLNEADAATAMRKHMGVVFDIGHQSVGYEDIPASLQKLVDNGVQIVKLQASVGASLRGADRHP